MGKNEIVAGLDFGSSQICCVLGSRDESGGLEILGGAKLPCRGIKGGVVINLNETSFAVQRVLEQIEDQAGQTVRQVYLGLRGNHIESVNAKGAINISRTDKEITAEDVAGVTENAKTIRLSNDREIINTIAQEYFLNHQGGVPDPVGMEGSHLEVEVHILTGSSSHLSNIYKSVAQAGFEIVEPIYGLLAVGDLVVTQEEKDLGCLLIDLGGMTTGISVYNEGSIRFSKELQIGSDFITRDLSHNLRTSLSTAQSIKEKYGVAMGSLLKTDSKFDFTGVDGKTVRQGTRKQLVEIIQPRLDQIFVAIDQELQDANLNDIFIPGGVIITGGGAMLEGMVQAAEQALGSLARIGLPQDTRGPEEIISNPTYATAIGLLKYDLAAGHGWASRKTAKGPSWWSKFRNWSDDIF
ncbi:MAG TPA: cell division protein FtsA [Elusimicrobia bacterium]|nr:MAG: cell division protein FtsA [Elusimicrobia bacterium RIFOXYA12_FULL_49_49]OGS10172.1 MAG: cell division protein FtsA [Elusimicrobia bacterium RIFOXYB1_FULL_48_9]OGS14980.1 MAG: cell division protein FtsA [Elusimicrobia bacterium RIFOXYA2_FULL_47_53]OGS26085.1 MAG: cell division protein FtsA [Elusimicrobia bacterium RIFOXYB12_FULL_50_12]OGS29324.1 MAG: cell division protein FtsA [Elusimicrobia bacterium RIFOXYB2_FULL_46_23]HBU70323.1 cell division protein FtsA [Elusimicrobiota bacterium]